MSSFIDSITNKIVLSNIPLDQWVIVVPSQRAVLYIQKSIYQHFKQTIFSPHIITITSFVDEVSPRIILDKTRLLFRLYEVYLKFSNDKSSFDEFYNWGKIILNDFDEIENYLVNGKDIFKNLKDIKEIENWSFNSEQLTERQLEFIEFWKQLGVYYQEFSNSLIQSNEVYRGKATREITENIDWIFKKYPENRILFAGFNAHSSAELNIIKQLIKLGRAEVVYDVDDYYFKSEKHEAGEFIKKNLAYLDIPISQVDSKNNISNKKIDIQLVGCSQLTGQVKSVCTILNSLNQEQIKETLVLLADENLLVPLLKNIPKNVGKANITLGLSLNNSILKTWIDLIFRIQIGLSKRSAAYHKDIFEICYHPFIQEILDEEEYKTLAEFEKNLKKNNVIYANPDKLILPEKLKQIFKAIYTNWKNNWIDATEIIRDVNSLIYSYLSQHNEYEKALIETFDNGIINLLNCLTSDAPQMSIHTFKNLFNEHYSSLKISYFGNPLDGLQITGLLETRMLDFKRIICLGMNEKNMPPQNQINSFIPMDLRRYFSMPTVREKQGLFAHHFYRLLHEVDELYITYSNQQEGINSFEKSRYIMQLELELTTINPNVNIQFNDYIIDNDKVALQDVEFIKDENNLRLLKTYLQHGVSASGIKNYFTCELDFFYKYILKYRDEQKVEEDIDNSTFGTLIHNTLENLYAPFANQQLTDKKEKLIAFREEDLKRIKDQSEYQLRLQFIEFFKNEEVFKVGKNRLNFEMALQLMNNFFDYELQRLRELGGVIYVEDLEHKLQLDINEVLIDNEFPVSIKGFIDRIDYHNGGYHIIDYKSGKVIAKDDVLIADKSFNFEGVYDALGKKKYFMQFYFYLYLFYQQYKCYPKSITFVPFVNTKDTENIYNENNKFEQLVEWFPDIMRKLVDEMLQSEEIIKHDPKSKYCDFC